MKRLVVPIIVGLVAGAVWAVIGPSLAVGVMPYGEIAKRTNGYTFGWCDSPRFPLCSGVSSYHSGSGKWDSCADWGITMMNGSLVEKPHLVTETVGVEIKEPDYQEMERRRIQKMTLVDDVSRTDFADSPRASP